MIICAFIVSVSIWFSTILSNETFKGILLRVLLATQEKNMFKKMRHTLTVLRVIKAANIHRNGAAGHSIILCFCTIYIIDNQTS